MHEERGDKILVFCDRPMIINYYGKILKYPVIYGDVSQDERKTIFNLFKVSNQINTIFLSRVGNSYNYLIFFNNLPLFFIEIDL